MDETEEMQNLENIDECAEFIAAVVASYFNALMAKNIPPELAATMVESCSDIYWHRHICILHGDEEEE